MINKESIAEYLNISVNDVQNGLKRGYDWVHKKTGNLYILDDFAIDATNSTEGRIMVIYHKVDPKSIDLYVRELKEFLEKFECPTERV